MITIDYNGSHQPLALAIPGGQALLFWKETADRVELTIRLPYAGAFGMGEKYNGINQKGRRVENAVIEHFCHQDDKTYCSMPFFFTDSGFGLFADTGCVTHFLFMEEILVTAPVSTPIHLFAGTPKEMIAEYMALSGRAKLPPKWAFGPWISANHWDTQQKVEQQIALLKEKDFPATVLVLEAWSDEATFYIFNGASYPAGEGSAVFSAGDFTYPANGPWPNPQGMIQNVHDAGLHLILWQIPVYKKQGPDEAPCPQNNADRAYAAQQGLCVKTRCGQPYEIPRGNWFAGSMIPDFTNPATCRLWFKKRQYLTEMGVDGFKTDGGEFIYRRDLAFHDGGSGLEKQNRYAQDYTAAYTRALGSQQVLFSRAGSTGQHTTPILWAGDQQSTFAELRAQLSAGLSAALSGIPFWGFDIGGFAGPLPSAELYLRATQMACFCPVMQWHSEPAGGQFKELLPGAEGNNERSPWNIASVSGDFALLDALRFYHKLRMNLLPYLYTEAMQSVENSTPMLRPLVYDWPQDAAALAAEDQYMLGGSLLVAPVLEEACLSRKIYFPPGEWFSLFDGGNTCGPCQGETDCRQTIPVYLKGGTGLALNLGENAQLGSDVGNRTDHYVFLQFWLAGECGEYTFSDDRGNQLALRWKGEQLQATGPMDIPYSVKRVYTEESQA